MFLSEQPYTPPAWAAGVLTAVPQTRIVLANVPTPIHPLHIPCFTRAGFELFVKRDDFTGSSELGGNKVRKLEFLLADAKRQGADCVVTIGGQQSNHCRATAAACRMVGLECFCTSKK